MFRSISIKSVVLERLTMIMGIKFLLLEGPHSINHIQESCMLLSLHLVHRQDHSVLRHGTQTPLYQILVVVAQANLHQVVAQANLHQVVAVQQNHHQAVVAQVDLLQAAVALLLSQHQVALQLEVQMEEVLLLHHPAILQVVPVQTRVILAVVLVLLQHQVVNSYLQVPNHLKFL